MSPTTDESLLPLLKAALDQTRSATCITTAELDLPGPQIVYVNPAYCEMTGRSIDEVIGKTPRIMQGPLTGRDVLDRLRADLEAGRPFVGETINYRKDGTPFLISWQIDPVRNADGVITHYIAAQDDITRLWRAERLLVAEQAIDGAVSSLRGESQEPSVSLKAMADEIAEAVAHFAEYGRPTVAGTVRLSTSRIHFHSGGELPDDGIVRAVTSDAAPGEVVSGRSSDGCWIGCSLGDERTGIDGALLITGLSAAELDFVDQAGLRRVWECARRAMDSLAAYERNRMVAVELQRNLLPAAAPEVDGLRLAARYHPASFAGRVGGDWYDVFFDDDRVVLVVGDVTGSGIRAAADMGRLRLLSRMLLQQGLDLPAVFASLNRFCAEEKLVATTLAVTVNRSSMAVTATTAGHPPPIVRHRSGARTTGLRQGPLLGIGGDPDYTTDPLDVVAGNIMLLFTDGLLERKDESLDVSYARLVTDLDDLPLDVDVVCDRILERRLAERPGDDIAVLAAQIVAGSDR